MDANGESLRGERSETPSNLMVERKRLVSRILDAAARSRTVFVCAPSGFGKTALLMQCTSAVSAAREGEDARLVDVRDMDGESLLEMLDDLSGEVGPESRSLIALDNFPTIASDKVEPVVQRMRALRDAGATLLVSCEPTAESSCGRSGTRRSSTRRLFWSVPTSTPNGCRRWGSRARWTSTD